MQLTDEQIWELWKLSRESNASTPGDIKYEFGRACFEAGIKMAGQEVYTIISDQELTKTAEMLYNFRDGMTIQGIEAVLWQLANTQAKVAYKAGVRTGEPREKESTMPKCPDCNDTGVVLVPGVVDIDGTQDWVDIPCPKGCSLRKPKCEVCKGIGVIQSLYHPDIPCPLCTPEETLTAWQRRLKKKILTESEEC